VSTAQQQERARRFLSGTYVRTILPRTTRRSSVVAAAAAARTAAGTSPVAAAAVRTATRTPAVRTAAGTSAAAAAARTATRTSAAAEAARTGGGGGAPSRAPRTGPLGTLIGQVRSGQVRLKSTSASREEHEVGGVTLGRRRRGRRRGGARRRRGRAAMDVGIVVAHRPRRSDGGIGIGIAGAMVVLVVFALDFEKNREGERVRVPRERQRKEDHASFVDRFCGRKPTYSYSWQASTARCVGHFMHQRTAAGRALGPFRSQLQAKDTCELLGKSLA
jgi:hypothetical protein